MAKRNPFRAAEDDAVEIDAEPSRKFKGSDEEPSDAETGEDLFDDLNPHFNAKLDRVAEKERRRAEADEEEEEDLDEDRDEIEDDRDAAAEDDEDEESPDEDEDEDEEEDARRRPAKGMDRRLARERRLREEAEDNYADVRARLDAIEEKQNLQASDSEFETFKTAQDVKIAAIRVKLAKAKEDGETEEEVRLIDELTDLRAELRSRETQRREAKAATKTRTETASPIVARKVAQWTRRHPRYHSDMLFQDFVKSADRLLVKQGYNPETEEYFRALDKEVKRRYPEEYKGESKNSRRRDEDRDTRDNREAPRRKRPPTANFAASARTTSTKKGEFQRRGNKIHLTKAQEANMRRFRMDPSNPNDVAEYVSNNQ